MKESVLGIFTNYYVPGFKAGGPIRSVFNLVNVLSKKKLKIIIYTYSKDFKSNTYYENIVFDKLINSFDKNCKIIYSKKKFNIKQVFKFIKKSNILYFNSFFNFHYTILPLIINLFFLSKKSCNRTER